MDAAISRDLASVIWVSSSPGELCAAALVDGVLTDYAISRPGRPDGVGDVYRGRVLARVPAMAGAFVALTDTEGFLPDSAGASGLTEGDAVRVRIVRAAQGGKGPRLRQDGSCEPGPPLLLACGPNAALRLVALHPGLPVRVDDLGCLATLRPTLGDRVSLSTDISDDIKAAMAELATPHALLSGGMRASFTPTPALIAIDIDAGSATEDRRGKPAAQMAANALMLPALARHIRLRNLSGAIVVDLAGMKANKRAALAPAFTGALASDPVRPRFLGFSALGLAEILRPRIHPPLHELLSGPHAAGLRALRQLVQDAAAEPSVAWALRAPPDVCAVLEQDASARADLARRTGRPLVLRPDPALPPGHTRLERITRA